MPRHGLRRRGDNFRSPLNDVRSQHPITLRGYAGLGVDVSTNPHDGSRTAGQYTVDSAGNLLHSPYPYTINGGMTGWNPGKVLDTGNGGSNYFLTADDFAALDALGYGANWGPYTGEYNAQGYVRMFSPGWNLAIVPDPHLPPVTDDGAPITTFEQAEEITAPIATAGTPEFNALLQKYSAAQKALWDAAPAMTRAMYEAMRQRAWHDSLTSSGQTALLAQQPLPPDNWNVLKGTNVWPPEGKTLDQLLGTDFDWSGVDTWLQENGYTANGPPLFQPAGWTGMYDYMSPRQQEAVRFLGLYVPPPAPSAPPSGPVWDPSMQTITLTTPDGRIITYRGALPTNPDGTINWLAIPGYFPTTGSGTGSGSPSTGGSGAGGASGGNSGGSAGGSGSGGSGSGGGGTDNGGGTSPPPSSAGFSSPWLLLLIGGGLLLASKSK